MLVASRSYGLALLANLMWFGNALPLAVIGLRSHGTLYYLRSTDFWLASHETRVAFSDSPGLENVLLPALGSVVRLLLNGAGLEYHEGHFFVLSIVPYLGCFVVATSVFSRGRTFTFSVAVAAALWGGGWVPYMLTWGGYVDGASYFLVLVAFLSMPTSIPVTVVATGLATANHYLGTLAIMTVAIAYYFQQGDRRYLRIMSYGAASLLAAQTAWWLAYPEAAGVRVEILLDKLQAGRALFLEVYGPTPWNLLSPLKLSTVPLLFALVHPRWLSVETRLAIALPLMVGSVAILGFVDVTRTASHFFFVSLLFTLKAMSRSGGEKSPTGAGRAARKIFFWSAIGSALLPVYYVNNGGVIFTDPTAVGTVASWLVAVVGGR